VECQPVPPEDCLRSLTDETLRLARPGHALLPDSLAVMATANAFVMLGLVAEPRAEEILAAHRVALHTKGLGGAERGVNEGELTVRPGAHEYWMARGDSAGALDGIPLRVLPAGVRLPVTLSRGQGEVCFEWLRLTRSGWRVSFRVTGHGHATAEQLLPQVALTDDTGHRYELVPGRGGWGRGGPGGFESHGEAMADPNLLAEPSWLEFSLAGGGATQRVTISPPPDVTTGTTQPRWPTPAEAFVESLARINGMDFNGTVLTPDQTAGIVAAAADCLMAVGALPVSSRLLRDPPQATSQEWRVALARRWGRRAFREAAELRPSERRGLVAELPLKHATAVIESVSVRGELVVIRLYGHPWVMGEYWPMITPCFAVHATDDDGNGYQGMPRNWNGGASHQGSGEFWFWPPVPESCERLTVTVSTLWETAWADIGLPGRTD
jgi:hypothetical protein